MQTTTDLDPPKRVHHLTHIFAISGWFIENETFLQYFTSLNYQKKQRTESVMAGVFHLMMFALYIYALMHYIHATSPSQFMEDIIGYRSACKSIGWEPKQDCASNNVIAFHANLKTHLYNLSVKTTIKFDYVQLNKGNGYDPKTGIFTAPEDGVYSFAWSFLSLRGSVVYIATVVDNVDHVYTLTDGQNSKNTSGHLLHELKKGNKVWIRIWNIPAKFIHGGFYTYFSGSKINSI